MQTASKFVVLALLAFGATTSHAINPQPLPPRHGESRINPQPLPPNQANSKAHRVAINPQPLPPRDSRQTPPTATARPYIGETEKNIR